MTASDRRFDLLHLLVVYNGWRTGNRSQRRTSEAVLRDGFRRVGTAWTGVLDVTWFTAALAEVRAEPGEYIPGSYERWRRSGLPAWAALAAGLRPTPPGAHYDEAAAVRRRYFPDGVDPQSVIDADIFSGRKISAIKAISMAYGLSLRESKDRMVARYEQLRAEQPDKFTVSRQE